MSFPPLLDAAEANEGELEALGSAAQGRKDMSQRAYSFYEKAMIGKGCRVWCFVVLLSSVSNIFQE